MTYKVLVTTESYITGNSTSVHTLVIDFDTELEANVAIDKINDADKKSCNSRFAIALY